MPGPDAVPTRTPATSSFAAGAERWLHRAGSGRDVVRQELAARFLARHLPPPGAQRVLRVLDAGCGQGAQAIRLAAAGHQVTGLDTDPRMLDALRAELAGQPAEVIARVDLVVGSVQQAATLLPPGSYDLVVCHGVLMYLDDPAPAVQALAAMLAPGGVLSVLARNQVGIAVRAGHRGRWAEAMAGLTGDTGYVNELGVAARADTIDGVHALVRRQGLEPLGWYGVRALSDSTTLAAPPPGADLAAMLAAEELAGRTDPYRQVAPLFQVLARRPLGGTVAPPA